MTPKRLLGTSPILFGAIGLALSLVLLYIHWQLATSRGEYTSFCNVSAQVNCDAVLGTEHAMLFGLPVAAWAALTYVVMLALAMRPGAAPALAFLALAGWSAGYSLVMAGVSFGVLGTVCLMCVGLYVINAALLVLALRAVARHAGVRQALSAGALPLALAFAFGTLTGPGSPGEQRAARTIELQDPEFYRWWTERPVRQIDTTTPPVHAKGPPGAPVTIVEYSDFACEHCARARTDLDRLLASSPGDVRLVFRHFPLDASCNPAVGRSLHPNACAAAMAAECAGELGRFWEFHDYLFDNQDVADLARAAAAIGLDAEQFERCMQSERGRAPVLRDVATAATLGVDSTPTLFFNGRTVKGALAGRYYDLALRIEKALADHPQDRSYGQ